MKRTKSFTLLIVAAFLLLLSIIFALVTYRNSYQKSVATGEELSAVKKQITAVEEGTATGDLDALQEEKAELSDLKLKQEKPYSFSLTFLFLSILLLIKGLYNAFHGISEEFGKTDAAKLAQAGLMAALCYIGFAFLKIDIPVGPEKTAFHFGNVFCVLGALLLGGFWGGLAGAVGMTIGDLTTAYVTSAPKTFVLKLCIGLIVGFVAHTLFKINKRHTKKYITVATIVSCSAGMVFNIFADPITGYFYKTYLLGVPQDLSKALAKMAAVTTSVNAVTAVIFASIIFLALRPALKKAGLLIK
ncbi:MAG: ECF transporter S component [Lachnospiraceae bacterium]|nr:ECF transporter S component [Lachnospiraceae bacterium]